MCWYDAYTVAKGQNIWRNWKLDISGNNIRIYDVSSITVAQKIELDLCSSHQLSLSFEIKYGVIYKWIRIYRDRGGGRASLIEWECTKTQSKVSIRYSKEGLLLRSLTAYLNALKLKLMIWFDVFLGACLYTYSTC